MSSYQLCATAASRRSYLNKLLGYQPDYASWSACEFALKPAPGLKLTNATIQQALAMLGPPASGLTTSSFSIFSGTYDAGLFYGAIAFTNLTTAAPVLAAKQICSTVATKLNNALPNQFFATPAVGNTTYLTGVYNPKNPQGLCECVAGE